ncbi:MAG: hypothetical protein K2L80_04820 [Muribaculaceae bacterium]|nr:hypothetical protein [Muribaculaceae bacterium]MDE6331907.1 hypothetical protein [Muribaculaceae bacterium]
MKVLLIGDFSNYHRALGDGLRQLGHDVTVASSGTQWLNTERDIDLRRSPGKFGGALLYARLRSTLLSRLSGYDVVQICSPLFVELRPKRVSRIFDLLKQRNGRVFLTALSTDSHLVERLSGNEPPLRYSEWQIGREPTPFALSDVNMRDEWLAPEMVANDKHIYDNIDGAVTALYEYHKIIEDVIPADRLAYAGIPIDIQKIKPVPMPPLGPGDPVRIMVAYPRARMIEKGADRLLALVRELERRHRGWIVVDEVTQLPYSEFVERIGRNHIVVDQLYSYTPGTTALLAMAMGRVAVSGGEEEYYGFIGEKELRPVVNTDPSDMDITMRRIEEVALDRRLLRELASQGPEFVRRHNASGKVAARFERFWLR